VLAEHATAFAYLLGALERMVTAPLEVAIVGPSSSDGADGTEALRREVHGRLLPASVTIGSEADAGGGLTPLLAERRLVDGKATAYVCEHFACRRPVTTPEDLREEIDAALAARRSA
jgi:uncharacterized protein YyaL (SSP411 family)